MIIFTGSDISRGETAPTYTHMAIAKLMNENRIKTLITENQDNFHRMSGVPSGDSFYQLHGNNYLETC